MVTVRAYSSDNSSTYIISHIKKQVNWSKQKNANEKNGFEHFQSLIKRQKKTILMRGPCLPNDICPNERTRRNFHNWCPEGHFLVLPIILFGLGCHFWLQNAYSREEGRKAGRDDNVKIIISWSLRKWQNLEHSLTYLMSYFWNPRTVNRK